MQAKKYTEQHEWVDLAEDGSTGTLRNSAIVKFRYSSLSYINERGLATIGITEYAAKALGDVVFVELPTVDSEVSAGDTIGAVESVKSASDIMTPVTGTVVEANMALEEKPKTINDSPEGEGWIARVKVTDASELEGLMDAKEYQASLEEEE